MKPGDLRCGSSRRIGSTSLGMRSRSDGVEQLSFQGLCVAWVFLLAGFSKWLKCKLTLASAMAPSTLDSGLRRLMTEAHFQNHDLFVQGLLRVRALANGEQAGCWKSLFSMVIPSHGILQSRLKFNF